MDILHCSFTTDAVGYYKSSGGSTPTFTYTAIVAGVASYALKTCAAIDVNQDGYMDIVFNSWSPTTNIMVVMSNGGSPVTFATPTAIGPVIPSYNLNVADFDKNGLSDIYFSGYTPTGGIFVMRNVGTAGAPIWVTQQLGSNAVDPYSDAVFVADINNDGNLDVIGADASEVLGGTSNSNNRLYYFLSTAAAASGCARPAGGGAR